MGANDIAFLVGFALVIMAFAALGVRAAFHYVLDQYYIEFYRDENRIVEEYLTAAYRALQFEGVARSTERRMRQTVRDYHRRRG